MERREFIRNAGLVVTWAGVAVALHGCGYGDDDDPVAPNIGPGDVAGSISANHGHSVKITDAQIDAGGAVALTLQGGTHTHTADLTAPQVAMVGAEQQVVVVSTASSGHTHQVTFN